MFGIERSKDKFSHRLKDWRRVSGYNRRKIVFKTNCVDVVRYQIATEIPDAKGRKIAFISDLHLRDEPYEKRILDNTRQCIEHISPDYLIIGGDVVSYVAAIPLFENFLASLNGNYKKIAAIGNWERSKKWYSLESWRDLYRKFSFELLVNENYDDDSVSFYGLDDIKSGSPVVNGGRTADKTCVMLSHNPDTAIHACRRSTLRDFDIILCGHTHGGQIRIPFLGPIVTSSRYYRKFEYGLHENTASGTRMIVSSGLGTSCLQFRIFCRREVIMVELV
jgi:predicted MPP superfamily phosphohydrolase